MGIFDDPSLAVYLCSHVFNYEKPILYVCKEGNEWQFLCGGDHAFKAKPHVVGVGHILERDSTIKALENLPDGWEAERSDIESDWVTRPIID